MTISTLLVLALLLGLIPAVIARGKGGSFFLFYILGVVVWPLALLISVIMADHRRKCPYCAESIRPAATVCPHCQRELQTQVEPAPGGTG